MTPQIVTMDGGRHNADLAKSSARIYEGAAWKKQRIVVLLPAAAQMPTKAALAMWSLIFPPNQGVVRMAAIGMEVGEAYSSAIEQVLANPELSQWEYILTVEHDNIPPQDGVLRLVKQMEAHPEFACIGGLYWTKGEEGVPQVWGDPKDPQINFRPMPPDPNGGLVECCGTGMGFNLWRIKMFADKRLRRPWFRTVANLQEGVGTQDLFFWGDARKYGYRCAVDCGVLVGHYDVSNDVTW